MERKKPVFLKSQTIWNYVTKTYGGMKAECHEFLNLALTVSGQLHAPAALTPRGKCVPLLTASMCGHVVSTVVVKGKISACSSSLYTGTTLTEL
jgi:hypothetical protein